jgi:YVTN family beta-propeller protein
MSRRRLIILNNRTIWAALAVLVLGIYVAGCGDTFRPTINFVTQPGGQNQNLGQAVVLSTNPSGNGSTTHIDVSGDTNVGVIVDGPNPVFLGKAGGRVFIINGDNSLTIYTGLSPLASLVSTLGLPPTVSGVVGGAASANGNLYLADSNSNNVTLLPGNQSVVTNAIQVGARPVMVAAGPNGNKAYVINHDDNTVTVIGTSDNAVIKTIPVGAQPIWGVMSDDGVDVFVVNQGDGTMSVIDTTLDQVLCNPASSAPCPSTLNLNGTSPSSALSSNFAFYDNVRKRVYVTNPGDNSVTAIKADSINLGVTPQVLPTVLAKIPLSGSPLSIAALADGTRAYTALAGCPVGTNHTNLLANLASCNGNQVSVIDVVALKEAKLIPVGAGAVSIASSTDGTKVYTANAHDGNISIIKTSTDSEIMRMPAPHQNLSCSNPSSCPSNVTQTPFMVVTFP